MNQQAYKVVQLDDEGQWKTVGLFDSYEDADFEIDRLTDQFPHGIFDLLEVPVHCVCLDSSAPCTQIDSVI